MSKVVAKNKDVLAPLEFVIHFLFANPITAVNTSPKRLKLSRLALRCSTGYTDSCSPLGYLPEFNCQGTKCHTAIEMFSTCIKWSLAWTQDVVKTHWVQNKLCARNGVKRQSPKILKVDNAYITQRPGVV